MTLLSATIEYEAELRHKNEMKRLEAKLHEKYVTGLWPANSMQLHTV